MKHLSPRFPLAAALIACTLLLAGCGAKPDQIRTVRSFEVSACNADPTTDVTQLAAVDKFKDKVTEGYFARTKDGLYAASHEATDANSGLRQYRGPFYYYVHPLKVEDDERARGVEWQAMVYLHAESVRVRPNGRDWGDWERVRMRNFTDRTRASDGMTRWSCLVNAEIAWARITQRSGVLMPEVEAVGAYEKDELERLQPVPTAEQIKGSAVPPQ